MPVCISHQSGVSRYGAVERTEVWGAVADGVAVHGSLYRVTQHGAFLATRDLHVRHIVPLQQRVRHETILHQCAVGDGGAGVERSHELRKHYARDFGKSGQFHIGVEAVAVAVLVGHIDPMLRNLDHDVAVLAGEIRRSRAPFLITAIVLVEVVSDIAVRFLHEGADSVPPRLSRRRHQLLIDWFECLAQRASPVLLSDAVVRLGSLQEGFQDNFGTVGKYRLFSVLADTHDEQVSSFAMESRKGSSPSGVKCRHNL